MKSNGNNLYQESKDNIKLVSFIICSTNESNLLSKRRLKLLIIYIDKAKSRSPSQSKNNVNKRLVINRFLEYLN